MPRSPSSTRVSDEELVRSCLAEERDAWPRLLETFSGLAWTIARQRLSAAEAPEVVNTAFTTVWMKLSELRDPSKLTAWIGTIVRREVSSFCRKQALSRQVPTVSLSSHEDLTDHDQTDPDVLEIFEIVRSAVDSLPERFRPLARALFLENDSQNYAEIAVHLGMARGSLGPVRQRLLTHLRHQLEPQLRGFWGDGEIGEVA